MTEPCAAPPLPDEPAAGQLEAERVRSLERGRLERLDLSRHHITERRPCPLVECTLTGTDLSRVRPEDTALDGCTLSYTRLRMTEHIGVRIAGCVLDEVDADEARLADVDRVRAEPVDRRGPHDLGRYAVGRLAGRLVDESPLPAMMAAPAAGAGLGIERVEEPAS